LERNQLQRCRRRNRKAESTAEFPDAALLMLKHFWLWFLWKIEGTKLEIFNASGSLGSFMEWTWGKFEKLVPEDIMESSVGLEAEKESSLELLQYLSSAE